MEIIKLTNVKNEEFEKIFRDYYKEDGIELKPDTKVFDEIQRSLDKDYCKVLALRNDGKLIAFIMYEIVKLSTEDKFFKQKLGFVREIYVLPSERNKGFSKVLMQNVENYFIEHGIKRSILNAHENMYEFYFKQGYYIDETYKCGNELKCLFKDLKK